MTDGSPEGRRRTEPSAFPWNGTETILFLQIVKAVSADRKIRENKQQRGCRRGRVWK